MPVGLTLFAVAALAEPDFSWLSGNWADCRADTIIEERWLGPGNGTLVAANLTRGPAKTSFEFLRIIKSEDGRWAFVAQPGGRAPVEFPAVAIETGRTIFENKANEFPQRVIYWREGPALRARIEGRIGGEAVAEEWTFQRMQGDAAVCGATSRDMRR